MKLKELEREINNQIEKENMIEGKYTYDETIQLIRKKVMNILIDNGFKINDYSKKDSIHVESGYGNGSNVVMKCSYIYGDNGIVIKIRRKRLEKEYKSWYGYIYYYGIKCIEIDDKYESIEDYIQSQKEIYHKNIEYRIEKKEKFRNYIEEEMGISFDNFFKIKKLWDSIDYSDKVDIAKEYVGEDYWRYI